MKLDDQRIRRDEMTSTMRPDRIGDGRAIGRIRFHIRSWPFAVACAILSMSVMLATGPSATHDGVVSFRASGSVYAQPAASWSVHFPLAVRNSSVPLPDASDVPWTRDADAVIGGAAWAVDVVGDVAYVSVGAHVVAYDVSGDGEPMLLGASPPLPGRVLDVVVRDGYAFAAVFQNSPIGRRSGEPPAGVYVLDVRSPAEMKVVTHRAIRDGVRDLDLDGDLLIALPGSRYWERLRDVSLFDVADPLNPRLIRQGDFEQHWWSVTLVGDHAYLCNSVLDVLNVLDLNAPTGEWLIAEELAECRDATYIESSNHLVTVSQIASSSGDRGDDDLPTLQVFDLDEPGRPALVGELPIFELEIGSEVSASDHKIGGIQAVGTSVFVSGVIKNNSPFLVELDVSEPSVPRLVSSRNDVAAGLAVDGYGDRIVVAGSSMPIGSEHVIFGGIEDGDGLRSAISVLARDEDGGLEVAAHLEGPSTVVSNAACHGETAYVFDSVGSHDRLWAYDMNDVYPVLISMAELPFDDAPITAMHDAVSVSEDGVFAAFDGAIRDVRWQDGRLELVETIEGSGALVRSGDHLVVAADDGILSVYDVSVPGSARRIGSVELPVVGRRNGGAYDLIEHKGSIWVLAVSPDGAPARAHLMVVQIDDPTRPTVSSSIETELEMESSFSAALAEDGDSVWVVTSYPMTVGRYSMADDGSEPRLVASLDHRDGSHRWPWSVNFAASEGRIWLPSIGFFSGDGELIEVEAVDETMLRVASIRTAPAAMRARFQDTYDLLRDYNSFAGVSSCGGRIIGTKVVEGMFVGDPAAMPVAADRP